MILSVANMGNERLYSSFFDILCRNDPREKFATLGRKIEVYVE
jgi:hypothetical protein